MLWAAVALESPLSCGEACIAGPVWTTSRAPHKRVFFSLEIVYCSHDLGVGPGLVSLVSLLSL